MVKNDVIIDDVFINIFNILLKNKSWSEMIEIFDNLDLNFEEKFDFCLYTTLEDNNNISPTLIYEFVPYIFNLLIKEDCNHFIKNMLELYLEDIIKCFKEDNLLTNVIISNDNVIDKLMNNKKFQIDILDNPDIIIKYQNLIDFFSNLPSNYGYLISLCNLQNGNNLSLIKDLYIKYYSNILQQSDIDELINIQKNLNFQDDIFEIGLGYRIKEFSYFLKKNYNDKNSYDLVTCSHHL